MSYDSFDDGISRPSEKYVPVADPSPPDASRARRRPDVAGLWMLLMNSDSKGRIPSDEAKRH